MILKRFRFAVWGKKSKFVRSPLTHCSMKQLRFSFAKACRFQSMWAELSGENFRSPLTWVFAPPLKVAPDRSAQFRSPLTYNFIPLRWNRSTLAQFKIPLHPNTCRFQPKPYAWDTLPCVADVERVCCVTAAEKNLLHFYCRGAAVAVWLDRTWYHAYSTDSVAALIC